MNGKQARALKPPDKVTWTWPGVPDKKPTPGIVQATTELAVRIKWDNAPCFDSVFAFSNSSVWQLVTAAETVPLPKPSKKGRAKKKPPKRKRK